MKKYFLLVGVVFSAILSMAQVPLTGPGIIEDIAGTPGKRAFAGDSGKALDARLANPMGIALDRFHNIYIADTNNHRIRRVEPRTGYIYTIAGTGDTAFYNDGGNATMATLQAPTALAIDEQRGLLFVADTGHHRIRLITLDNYPELGLPPDDPFRYLGLPNMPSADEPHALPKPANQPRVDVSQITIPRGYIYTIAGTGRRGYDGEGTKARASALNNPSGLAISPNHELYISDAGNNRIRKIDKQTGLLVTVVGTGEAGDDGDYGLAINAKLNRPTVIKFDKHGNLFIVDTGNHKIRFVDHKSGRIFTIAGDGRSGYKGDNSSRATDARFNDPTGLALDKFGRIYVSDTDNHRIRRITIDLPRRTSFVETVVGTGKRGYNGDDMNTWDVNLAYPGGMLITPHDVLYFLDAGNNVVRRVQAISTVRPPTSYNVYSQPEEEVNSDSFLEVLYKPKMQAE